jgi:hypothetical protein
MNTDEFDEGGGGGDDDDDDNNDSGVAVVLLSVGDDANGDRLRSDSNDDDG